MPYIKDATHKTTKDKILEVAIDLFSKQGYHGVSIRNITKEVGIKESSLCLQQRKSFYYAL